MLRTSFAPLLSLEILVLIQLMALRCWHFVNDFGNRRRGMPPQRGNATMIFSVGRALSTVATIALLCVSTAADAGGRVALTDRQLDGVTASQGGPFAAATASATGLGLTTFGGTNTIAITGVSDSPFGGSNAYASGTAYGGGMNGPVAGSGTADATSFTEAPGNVGVTIGYNFTVYGVGTTAQTAFSSSVGIFMPGVP
jgi:hypothetical protein